VKRFPAAKTRLNEAVVQPARRELAAAMVEDVLTALGQVARLSWIVVVTAEEEVTAPARRLGVEVVADLDESGQSAAVLVGIERAIALGAERVLCVPGDCPALDPAEVATLLRPRPRPPAGEVIVVPDRHGTGTNALLLTPPGVMAPSFGADSCQRHLRLAAAVGAAASLEHPPSLLLDVDTGADLQALRDRLALDDNRAARTRAVLARLAAAPTGVRA
jgi:2-phospho-L-lactate guanylyltransferase